MVVAAICVGFAIGLLMQFVVLKVLVRRSILDYPSERSSHSLPTPRGGGVAVVMGFATGALLISDSVADVALVAATVLAALVGALEDFRGLPPQVRLVLQFLASLPVVILAALSGFGSAYTVALVGILCLVGTMNAVNFMDGINGITAGVGISASLCYYAILTSVGEPTLSTISLVLAAACLSFLPFNAHKARVFLGDSGSYGLGGALGSLALLSWVAGVPALAGVAPLAVYVADTSWTLFRRWRRGEVLFDAHRSHVYQQLIDMGLSHDIVASYVSICVLVCGLMGAALAYGIVTPTLAGIGIVLVLSGYLTMPAILRSGQPER